MGVEDRESPGHFPEQRIVRGRTGRTDVVEAEFLSAAVRLAAKHLREQLATEADTEHRQPLLESALRDQPYPLDGRIVVVGIRESRKRHEAVIRSSVRQVLVRHVNVELQPLSQERRGDPAERLVPIVLHHQHAKSHARRVAHPATANDSRRESKVVAR